MKYLLILAITLIIFIIILFCVYSYIIRNEYYKFYNENNSKYVQFDYELRDDFKNIFCFWNDEVLPPLINECVKKMKRKMPDWNVILLNDKTIYKLINECEFPPNLKNLNIQAQTDWYRLYLLYQYGGLWLDVSIVLNDPDEINKMYKKVVNENMDIACFAFNHHHFYFNDNKYQCIESWCLLSKSKNKIIKAWLDEFNYAIKIGFKQYSDYINENKFTLTNSNISHGTYHTIYKCFIVIVQKNKIDFNKIYIRNPEKTMCRHLFKPFLLRRLLSCKLRQNIKLISSDRTYLDFNIYLLKRFFKIHFKC